MFPFCFSSVGKARASQGDSPSCQRPHFRTDETRQAIQHRKRRSPAHLRTEDLQQKRSLLAEVFVRMEGKINRDYAEVNEKKCRCWRKICFTITRFTNCRQNRDFLTRCLAEAIFDFTEM